MIVKEDEYTFLVRRKERQTGDGVRSKDQRVDRGDSDRILENARQTETHRSEGLREKRHPEKQEDLETEGNGDERSRDVARVVPGQVGSLVDILRAELKN